MAQVTQRDGRRWSCADAFLRPALKDAPNLELVNRATVLGLELEGERAIGVRYRRRGRERVVRAEREVILAAGAIGSPQILLLSGIGPGRTTCARSASRSAMSSPASGATCTTIRS